MTGKALTLNMSNTLFKQIRLHYIKYFVLLSGTNIYTFLNQDKFTGHANMTKDINGMVHPKNNI